MFVLKNCTKNNLFFEIVTKYLTNFYDVCAKLNSKTNFAIKNIKTNCTL